jgi:hypothetical protein
METRYFAAVSGKALYKVQWDTSRDAYAGGVFFDHLIAKSWGGVDAISSFIGDDTEPMHPISKDAAKHLFVGYGGDASAF